jgi:hypothetical protein
VIIHGRFSGFGQPVKWIAVEIVRIEDGVLVEQWGRGPGRSYAEAIQERKSNVWRQVPHIYMYLIALN